MGTATFRATLTNGQYRNPCLNNFEPKKSENHSFS